MRFEMRYLRVDFICGLDSGRDVQPFPRLRCNKTTKRVLQIQPSSPNRAERSRYHALNHGQSERWVPSHTSHRLTFPFLWLSLMFIHREQNSSIQPHITHRWPRCTRKTNSSAGHFGKYFFPHERTSGRNRDDLCTLITYITCRVTAPSYCGLLREHNRT
ncbi:hypothetical protein BDZ45DRAFT_154446 [Acephala macrosclerotiorum]|nr:hypothetical protein BDZ45DRAFT_154446 [Acephala macrosclerotiorum]